MRSAPIGRGVRIAALVALACHPMSRTPTPAQPGQRDEIGRPEIETVLGQSATAYDIIKRLRPAMLLHRTVAGVELTPSLMAKELRGVHVHVDDVRVGDFDILSTIPAQAVASIRWLSPNDASTRYGNGHTTGVIAVTTLGGRW